MKAMTLGYWISSTKPIHRYLMMLLIVLSTSVNALETTIYDVQNTSPEHVGNSIKALYPEALISHQQGQLIIRAPASQLPEINELLPIIDKAQQRYTLTLASYPSLDYQKTYSNRSNKQASYQLVGNETLNIEYTQQELQLTAINRFYSNIENVDTDNNFISLSIKPIGLRQVEVNYTISHLKNHKRDSINSTMQVKFGEWVSMAGERKGNGVEQKVSIATKHQGAHLYILINKI